MATENDLDSGTGAPAPEPAATLRDDIDAAFAQHATDEVDEPAGRARDEHGRFTRAEDPGAAAGPGKAPAAPSAPAAPAAAPGAPRAAAAPGAMPPAPPPPELKAPASWTPAAREKWGALDPELRAEIHRREGEAQRLLQETAGVRQFAQQFAQIVQPYEMFIRAENSDPLRAVQSLMNTAAQLRVGTPQAKVGIVASIIQQHGIDLQMLDAYMAQQLGIPPGGSLPPQPPRDPRVDQILAQQQAQQWQQQQAQQQREAWETSAIQQGLAQFAQTHEFYFDVADTMADLVDRATARGQEVDLEKIYARACQLDEQVSTILSQRAAAPQAPTGNGARPGQPATSPAVLRAKRAAASVKGDPTPTGATVPKDDSIRASIEAAFDAHAQ